ncbi:terpene synthase family protein [Streptomyces lavendulocolor]|uniref:terpene synthase family protein n=1 Tax=Streptomyces lavendulocolor TaxID=67316 RepID=UPI003C2FEAB8
MTRSIAIPPLWCPIDLEVRPGAARVQAGSHAWLERHGLDDRSLRRAAATDTGFLACSWAPTATDEGVQLLSDWLVWALLFDDYYCDSGPHADRPGTFNPLAARMMARALHPETPPTGDAAFDAFGSALADLTVRIHDRAAPELAHLCSLAHYHWAVGAMCGVSDRAAGSLRSVDDHLLIRPPDGGSLLSVHIIEVAEGTVLPARERVRPEVRALTQAAGILLTVPTDLASYAHEQAQGSLESNLVHILGAERSLSAQAATDQVCDLLETVMSFFLAMYSQLRQDADSDLRRYTDHLAHMVRGTYEWQRFLPRYSTVLDTPEHPDGTHVSRPDTPLHTITRAPRPAPVHVPAPIAWWWDLLA